MENREVSGSQLGKLNEMNERTTNATQPSSKATWPTPLGWSTLVSTLVAGPHDPMDSSDDDHAGRGEGDEGTGTATISKPKSRTKTPPMYRVILMNDDFTPMDFVIHVLQKFFQKGIEEATRIMLQVHTQGAGICGTFSYEIAETKVYQVNQYSRQNHHPLKCVMEKT